MVRETRNYFLYTVKNFVFVFVLKMVVKIFVISEC